LLSLPKTVFPGGALIGDDAGFLNASRIKGSHAAIKTGMLAADAAFDAVQAGRQSDELNAYPDAFKQSWLYTELYRARNFKQWMAKGLYLGTLMVGLEQKVMGGNVPWTLHHQHADHEMLKPASQCEPIEYPKPDGKLTFDRLSSVFISNTNHEENQPAHLTLKDASVPVNVNRLLSLPKTVFPGGALIGDDAGFLNASRIKGSHAAIKTGMLAADAAFDAVQAGRQSDELNAYPDAFKQSWLYTELYRARNFKQWMAKGLYLGTLMVGLEQKVMGGNVPWTLHHRHADHEMLKPASQCEPIAYPKPDGKLTFDRLSSVFISNTNHEENQPAHLTLKDASVPVNVNLRTYAGPEARFCPAAVYEFVKNDDGGDRLVINAQNCVHCKTCDIKDPTQNIVWVTPEGGGGPNYPNM
ncbi:4Fe-4S dicluster domain-containing protein, partial [Burkholderia cenocepacia]|uniref:electron transfer flavoprotein-ubiquinone oxidoreductase n=1 Tax=Burkholderia cenocepacia TaxID=95486 RepID=UPI00286F462A